MAEPGGGERGGIRVCNQSCGCAIPCPGGNACKCATATAGGEVAHRQCPCGERGGIRACNQSCGCAVPCPGGNACKCATATAGEEVAHRQCPCGEHCECDPCTCPSAVVGVGKGSSGAGRIAGVNFRCAD